jgi:hypothetical protein
MIADGLPASGAASWKLSGFPSGRYWPYAIVNQNGVPVSIQYWPRSVEVADPAAPDAPTGVQTALNSGEAYVVWDAVAGATTYAITATPTSGRAPVRDAVLAGQLADQLALRPGTCRSPSRPSTRRTAPACRVQRASSRFRSGCGPSGRPLQYP